MVINAYKIGEINSKSKEIDVMKIAKEIVGKVVGTNKTKEKIEIIQKTEALLVNEYHIADSKK